MATLFNTIYKFILDLFSTALITSNGFTSTMKGYVTQIFAIGYDLNSFFPVADLLICLGIVLSFELGYLLVRVILLIIRLVRGGG